MLPAAMLSHLPAGVLVITAASQVMPPVAMPSHLPAGVSVITAASQVMLPPTISCWPSYASHLMLAIPC
jgi:hypothetical protein